MDLFLSVLVNVNELRYSNDFIDNSLEKTV